MQVEVCPKEICTTFGDKEDVVTGPGTPPTVNSFSVSQKEKDGECVLSWSTESLEYAGYITSFKVGSCANVELLSISIKIVFQSYQRLNSSYISPKRHWLMRQGQFTAFHPM